jgi:HEAT repeat protein
MPNEKCSERNERSLRMLVWAFILQMAVCPEAYCHRPPTEVVIAGRSIPAWRAVIGQIDPRDPASRQFVPGLIELMSDVRVPWITRRQAALTLGRMGPLAREAIPSLTKRLHEIDTLDPEMSPQRWALSALALYGREAREVAPQLIELLQDEDSTAVTKLGCLEALSQIGSAAPDGIAAIWRELDRGLSSQALREDRQSALGAAEALGMIGPDAATAVPVLLRAAQSDEPELRQAAIQSLGQIGPRAHDAQPMLIDVLIAEEDPVLRDLATTALRRIGPSGWGVIQKLLAADDAEIRSRAAAIVADWKTIRASILPSLEPLLADADPNVRLAACQSWRRLTERHERVWPHLVELLLDASRPIRRDASRELQSIARTSAVTDAELASLLESSEAQIRREGLRLQRIREELTR